MLIFSGMVDLYAAVFNWVSQILWPVNWRIWFFVADKTHQHPYQIEQSLDLVDIELGLMLAVIAVLSVLLVRKRLAR